MQAAASGNAQCTVQWGITLQSIQWGIRVEAPVLSQSAKTKVVQVKAVIDPAPQILILATYLVKLELILYQNVLWTLWFFRC